MNGVELTNQVIQIFPADMELCCRKIHKGKDLLEISLWQGYCDCLCVDIPHHDFLDTGKSSIPRQEIFEARRVFYLIGKGREESLEDSDSAIKDLA